MVLWSTKRRLMFGGGFVLIVAIILSGIFWSILYRAPTCSDGVKNGDETGVDCGGSCQRLCTNDALTPVVLWAKAFNISGDVYSVVAYVENPNVNSKNNRATYQFRIFDENGKLITVKEGETSIPKGKKFAIFENGLVFKNAKPKSADFHFVTLSEWKKDSQTDTELSLKYGTPTSTSTAPNISGTVSNTSLQGIPEVELVVFVLDNNENVIAASRTFVDNLRAKSSQDFVFTWQKPFDGDASVVNIMYRSI